ncbi:MAG: GHKL domain-containing protein [Clostridia bacterium]|nr:GHKL domain-containing protein [Clostridia bacterium]
MTKKIFLRIFSVSLGAIIIICTFGLLGYIYDSVPLLIVAVAFALLMAIGASIALAISFSQRLNRIENCLKCMNSNNYLPSEIEKVDSSDTLYPITSELCQLNKNINKRIISEKNEKAKLQQVLDNVSQGIIALSYTSDIVHVNNSALKIFSGNGDYINKKLIFLIDDIHLVEKILSYNEEDGAFEYKIGDKELSFAIRIIFDKNLSKKISKIIIVTDVTKQKAMATQKSDFFANASHELKTPITVMLGLTELLSAKEGIDESSKKQIERIHKEGLRMASLIADMLKLSRLERSEQLDELTNVNLRSVCEEILGELSTQLASKKISWEINGEGSVIADNKKIFELVGNILSNAVNYNKENGSIKIVLAQTKEKTVIQIKDTGIGIEKEHIPRLCERFYRVDKSRSKKTGGTGLGLAIVKHICALYSADLKIESQIGEGTQVSVTFNNVD